MSAAKKKRGRPRVAAEMRASRRVGVRLYAADALLLEKLSDSLEVGDGEVIRLALHELARRERVR